MVLGLRETKELGDVVSPEGKQHHIGVCPIPTLGSPLEM